MELIIGPMFSGKSTELIRRINRLKSIGKNVLVINSNKDTRCQNEVQTHDQKNYTALKTDTIEEIINKNIIKDYDIIAIDEAQFFPDLYQGILTIWEKGDKEFIISGLDGDFKQEKFGQILELIPLATKVDKLSGYCNLCKDTTEGTYSIRVNSLVIDTEYIGGKEDYICVCYKHLLEQKKYNEELSKRLNENNIKKLLHSYNNNLGKIKVNYSGILTSTSSPSNFSFR